MTPSKSLAPQTITLLLLLAVFHPASAAPGDLDLSFDPGSGVNGAVNTVALQPDGKIVVGGSFSTVKGLSRTNVARLQADGSGDSGFDLTPGLVGPVNS